MIFNYNFKNYNFRLLLYVLALNVIGILVINSASGQDEGMVMKQMMGIALGLAMALVISRHPAGCAGVRAKCKRGDPVD